VVIPGATASRGSGGATLGITTKQRMLELTAHGEGKKDRADRRTGRSAGTHGDRRRLTVVGDLDDRLSGKAGGPTATGSAFRPASRAMRTPSPADESAGTRHAGITAPHAA
jgi:hypothetical protein